MRGGGQVVGHGSPLGAWAPLRGNGAGTVMWLDGWEAARPANGVGPLSAAEAAGQTPVPPVNAREGPTALSRCGWAVPVVRTPDLVLDEQARSQVG